MKFLYVLALLQLVGGPLVILQVTVFCKLTVSEARHKGVGSAFTETLRSPEFQAVMRDTIQITKKDAESPSPTPKGKIPDLKASVPLWKVFAAIAPPSICRTAYQDWARRWTPVWPQAPPGPPPRIG